MSQATPTVGQGRKSAGKTAGNRPAPRPQTNRANRRSGGGRPNPSAGPRNAAQPRDRSTVDTRADRNRPQTRALRDTFGDKPEPQGPQKENRQVRTENGRRVETYNQPDGTRVTRTSYRDDGARVTSTERRFPTGESETERVVRTKNQIDTTTTNTFTRDGDITEESPGLSDVNEQFPNRTLPGGDRGPIRGERTVRTLENVNSGKRTTLQDTTTMSQRIGLAEDETYQAPGQPGPLGMQAPQGYKPDPDRSGTTLSVTSGTVRDRNGQRQRVEDTTIRNRLAGGEGGDAWTMETENTTNKVNGKKTRELFQETTNGVRPLGGSETYDAPPLKTEYIDRLKDRPGADGTIPTRDTRVTTFDRNGKGEEIRTQEWGDFDKKPSEEGRTVTITSRKDQRRLIGYRQADRVGESTVVNEQTNVEGTRLSFRSQDVLNDDGTSRGWLRVKDGDRLLQQQNRVKERVPASELGNFPGDGQLRDQFGEGSGGRQLFRERITIDDRTNNADSQDSATTRYTADGSGKQLIYNQFGKSEKYPNGDSSTQLNDPNSRVPSQIVTSDGTRISTDRNRRIVARYDGREVELQPTQVTGPLDVASKGNNAVSFAGEELAGLARKGLPDSFDRRSAGFGAAVQGASLVQNLSTGEGVGFTDVAGSAEATGALLGSRAPKTAKALGAFGAVGTGVGGIERLRQGDVVGGTLDLGAGASSTAGTAAEVGQSLSRGAKAARFARFASLGAKFSGVLTIASFAYDFYRLEREGRTEPLEF